ncbi:MAG: TauD/TfdA family dioxygenase [Sphingomonadales bacterium]|nr:TauD/TfdA family dioxygenase [Sphingomonadales bacterium]
MELELEPITPVLGARVRIGAADVLRPGVAEALLAALDRHDVLVFPRIGIDDDTFLALTAALGEKHEVKATDDGSAASGKGIFRVARDKDDRTQREFILGNDFWHIDGMNYAVPVKATLLKCERAPREGGDTGFASLRAAWEALPAARREALAPLRVGHCLSACLRRLYDAPTAADFARWDAVFARVEHPLAWRRRDGQTTLLIGSTANDIAGMDAAEGRALLDELVEWSTQERFTLRHHWHDGDLVIFHNAGLLHRSYPYGDGAGRVMHRTTLKGSEATTSGGAAALAY